MKKFALIIILIMLAASFLRLWHLDQVPSSMTDDEVRLTYNAYSIWHTAKDINGLTLPLTFVAGGYAFNPIPIYITSPFVGLLGLDMFSARLPFALAGILTIFFLYKITNQLIKNKTIAIFSSAVLTFSAWHLQISRFAYEGQFALLFFVLGIFLFFKIKKNEIWCLVLSMMAFLAAFYSYSGTKLIWLPIILILVWYERNKLNSKQLLFILFSVVITILSFIMLSKYQGASSYGKTPFFFQKTGVEMAVELERRTSLAPEFLKKVYHNKFTYWSKIFIDQYTYALSPQYLFTSQEGNGIFSIWFRGEMYFIEAPLILLGLLYLFYKKRKELFLVLLFLVIAPLPSALGSDPVTYTMRSSFMLPWLAILVGSGIYSISYFLKNHNTRVTIYIILVFSYIYLIGGYFTQYYSEWVIYGAKYYSKSEQDLVFFLKKEIPSKRQIVVGPANSITLLHYAFYNKVSPSRIQKLYGKDSISFDNIIFQRFCPSVVSDPKMDIQTNFTYIISSDCHIDNPKLKLYPSFVIRSPDNLDEWLIIRN